MTPDWRRHGDQPGEEAIAAALGDNLVLQAVLATGRDDVIDFVGGVQFELPAEPLRISRLAGRGSLGAR